MRLLLLLAYRVICCASCHGSTRPGVAAAAAHAALATMNDRSILRVMCLTPLALAKDTRRRNAVSRNNKYAGAS
ncbi:hypothetical protein J7355_12230 [Endozoicomonas sp. G2_2]|uniref:hypothetical protein n=1 Tax=Endozoicomonas sp. G2_2 TaxID=2821092 RepID=UPI001ADB0BEA|nr:hypothetical protein [Endozoicomonas sp. G2_2]MBO9470872.1 hypothetical protein [Endozoicomonas sp. G2_2]